MKVLQLSITEFALPAPRVGSIEAYSGYGPLPNVGSEIHLLVQNKRVEENSDYQAERWISHTFAHEQYRVTVSGRMDGYWPGPPSRIEEIKTAYSPSELVKALEKYPEHPYRLQLRTYGYIQWLHTGAEPETVLHIVSSRTREGFDYPVAVEAGAYEDWLKRRLIEVVQEHEMFERLKERRKKVAKTFSFPFEAPRAGQIELMSTVEENLTAGGKARLLLQAPTGLGKTAGVLFPSLKEAFSRGQKVLYVTPKNSQHAVAEDAVKRLQKAGTKARALTIHAKTKMCFKEQTVCNPEYCEFAKDYYSKVSDHDLIQKLAKKKSLSFRTFQKFGREYEVCPFELQMDAVPRADVIICDYNYVFSPRNSIARLSANGYDKKSAPNLVIDEAHNLPSRACDYYSAQIRAEELLELQAGFLHLTPDLKKVADRLVDDSLYLLESSAGPQALKPTVVELDSLSFITHGAKVGEFLSRYLESPAELQPADRVLTFCNLWSTFTQSVLSMTEEFFATFTPGPQGGTLRITCCDAAQALNLAYAEFANVVAFSATVKPFDYYAKLLGFYDRPHQTAEFHSPFPRERRKLLIVPQVSTKYSDREANYGKISDGITRIVQLKPGNYFAFFPSFEFLKRVSLGLNLPGFRVLQQKRDMKRQDVLAYIESLQRQDQPTLILAVQGGVFAEGVDYPGEMLIGAIVVGPALPTFDFERELLRDYYAKKHGPESSFDYAYTYPAMAKVVQSAGRVIRSHDDRGLIVLMDRRFMQASYVKSMPADWVGGDPQSAVSTQILEDIRQFWKQNGP